MSPRQRLINLGHAVVLIVLDAAMVYLAFRVAAKIQRLRDLRIAPEGNILASALGLQITIVTLCVLVAFVFHRLYIRRRGQSRVDLLFSLVQAILVGFGAALAGSSLFAYELTSSWFSYTDGETTRAVNVDVWRSTLVLWAAFSLLLIWSGRLVLDLAIRLLHKQGVDSCRVLIVGAGEAGQMVLEKILHAPELGYKVVGFVDDRASGPTVGGVPLLGSRDQVLELVDRYKVDEIIVAAHEMTLHDRLELVSALARREVNIKIVPDIFEIMSSEVTTSDLTGLPMLQVRDVALRGWSLLLKRVLDLVVSAALLVVLAPLLMLVALLVKLSSRSEPVFYTQERVGLDGRPFHILKFRSMRSDAEAESGPVWARPDDPRRTQLGAFLRRWSLDELPQLVNVLVGEMSLVGPRPERPHFVKQFTEVVPRYSHRHNEKAGLTGHAQVHGLRGDTSIEERTTYDVYYVERWSLAFDVKILMKTIAAVFRDRNAY